MAYDELIIGQNANDGNGESLRSAMVKISNMLAEVYDQFDKYREGAVSVNEGTNEIIFVSPYPEGTTYKVLRNNSNNYGEVNHNISNQTEAGFTLTSAENAVFVYKTIKL